MVKIKTIGLADLSVIIEKATCHFLVSVDGKTRTRRAKTFYIKASSSNATLSVYISKFGIIF
jgi:hypothetical protein